MSGSSIYHRRHNTGLVNYVNVCEYMLGTKVSVPGIYGDKINLCCQSSGQGS